MKKVLFSFLIVVLFLPIVPMRAMGGDTTIVTIGDNFRNSSGSANGVYFEVSPNDNLLTNPNWILSQAFTGHHCIYIDGNLNSSVPIFKITENVYYIGLSDIGVKAEHGTTVRIEGALSDGISTVQFIYPAVFEYSVENEVGAWTMDPRLSVVNISDDGRNVVQNDKGIYFNVSQEDGLEYSENWKRYFGKCVYVNNQLYTSIPIFKITPTLYYVAVNEVCTPITGMQVRIEGELTDGTHRVRFCPAIFEYGADNHWGPYVQHIISSNYKANWEQPNENYIYFFAKSSIELPASWTIGYSGDFLKINGMPRTDIPIKHIGKGICLVDLYGTDLQNETKKNMTVQIEGVLKQGAFDIKFQSICFQYSEDEDVWKLSRRPAMGIVGDANGDESISIADLVRMKHDALCGENAQRLASEDAIVSGGNTIQERDLKNVREILLGDNNFPLYSDDLHIQLAAYAGPSVSGKAIFTEGIQTDTLSKSLITEKEFKRYRDAGLNTLISEGGVAFASIYRMGSGGGHWAALSEYMQLAENMDLDVIVSVEAMNAYLEDKQVQLGDFQYVDVTDDFLKDELEELLTGYVKQTEGPSYHVNLVSGCEGAKGLLEYSNFKGFLMADEIDEEYLDNYSKAHEILWSLNPKIKTFFTQYAGGTYAEEFGPIAGNFCYDYYPLIKNNSVGDSWLKYLQETATMGKGKFETGVTLQSFGQTVLSGTNGNYTEVVEKGLKIPSEKRDIGFQVYTSLAYGMKNINYFTYTPHWAQSKKHYFSGSMVEYDEEHNLVETSTYYAVQAVNREILQFDHVFLDYDWQGTIAIEKTATSMFDELPTYISDRICSYDASQNAVIGCMRDFDKGMDGFWVVNATNPYDNLSNTVTVTFDNATQVVVYNPAKEIFGKIEPIVNGTYTLELASGEGQFIIPIK